MNTRLESLYFSAASLSLALLSVFKVRAAFSSMNVLTHEDLLLGVRFKELYLILAIVEAAIAAALALRLAAGVKHAILVTACLLGFAYHGTKIALRIPGECPCLGGLFSDWAWLHAHSLGLQMVALCGVTICSGYRLFVALASGRSAAVEIRAS